MPLRRLLNVLRVIFLGVFIAAIGARVAWTKYPEHVDKLDEWIVEASQHEARRELQSARKAQEDGEPEVAVEHLLNVAEVTEGIKRGDRLESVRAPSLMALRDHYHRTGDLEKALEWANQLHELDERNLPNELARARLMGALQMPEESLALLAWLNDLTQGQDEYGLAYFDQLVRAEQGKEAVELLLQMEKAHGLTRPMKAWEIRYRQTGTPNPAALTFDLKGEKSVRGGVEVEVAADSLTDVRIDAPRGASIFLQDPTLVLSLNDGSEVKLGLEDITRLNHLNEADGGLLCRSQQDPFMVWSAPELPAGAVITGAVFQAGLRPILPERLYEFLSSDLGTQSLQEVAAEHQAGAGTDIEHARLLKLQELLRG